MANHSSKKREQIRELVREMLNAAPETAAVRGPEHLVVNSLKDRHEREFDRDESGKPLITEIDIRGLEAGSRLRVAENAKFTPLAADLINERNIAVIKKVSRGDGIKVRTVAIGADHGGFEMKELLKEYLSGLGLRVRDVGTHSKEAVDYPDFAHLAAVSVGEGRVDIGIMIDGAGIGSAMAANKVPNVRAAACYNAALAKNSREHNGANMLTLGSGQNSFEEVKQIVHAFITTEISEPRHIARVAKIGAIQTQYSKK